MAVREDNIQLVESEELLNVSCDHAWRAFGGDESSIPYAVNNPKIEYCYGCLCMRIRWGKHRWFYLKPPYEPEEI